MLRAFERMLKFYGLKYESSNVVSIAKNHIERIDNLIKNTHNNLRITRILTSLKLHGLDKEAGLVIDALHRLASNPMRSAELKDTFNQHWASAAHFKEELL